MNKWLKATLSTIVIIALSIVALGSLTFSQSYAQSSTDNDGRRANFGERIRSMVQNFGQNRFGPGRGGFGKGAGHNSDMVAEALGITADELAAAREAGKSLADLQAELGVDAETFQANLKIAAIAQVNQKLADGEITQEKADAWIAKIESSEFSMGGRGVGKGHGHRSHGHRGHGKGAGHDSEMAAEALGITADELAAAREAGKSLADLQAELGVDAETFQANLKTAAIAQVNQKLADGEITQEKADAWIAKIESSEFSTGGRGFGKGHGHRGHHGSDMKDGKTEESDTDVDDGDKDEESAGADGASQVAATGPLFRVVSDVQAGDMSLYLPMMTNGNN